MIVVTGATGHLGNNLVRALSAGGRTVDERAPSAGRAAGETAGRVRCVVLPGDDLRPLEGLEVEIVEGDVRDPEFLVKAFRGASVVYHLASVIALTPARARLVEEVNVKGTRNVVSACLETGVGRLVYVSSVHALVEPPPGEVIDESAPVDPDRIAFAYGKSKARATLEVLKAVDRGLDAVIACPTGIIGPYDFGPSEIGEFFITFARGGLPAYVDGGYDFVDVRDVAAGLISAARLGRAGELYLLSGEQMTVREMLRLLEELTEVKAPRLRLPVWVADGLAPLAALYYRLTGAKAIFTSDSLYYLRSNSLTSHAKAACELGFSPRPIRESIADTLEWMRDSGMLQGGRLRRRKVRGRAGGRRPARAGA